MNISSGYYYLFFFGPILTQLKRSCTFFKNIITINLAILIFSFYLIHCFFMIIFLSLDFIVFFIELITLFKSSDLFVLL